MDKKFLDEIREMIRKKHPQLNEEEVEERLLKYINLCNLYSAFKEASEGKSREEIVNPSGHPEPDSKSTETDNDQTKGNTKEDNQTEKNQTVDPYKIPPKDWSVKDKIAFYIDQHCPFIFIGHPLHFTESIVRLGLNVKFYAHVDIFTADESLRHDKDVMVFYSHYGKWDLGLIQLIDMLPDLYPDELNNKWVAIYCRNRREKEELFSQFSLRKGRGFLRKRIIVDEEEI